MNRLLDVLRENRAAPDDEKHEREAMHGWPVYSRRLVGLGAMETRIAAFLAAAGG
jgi:hypothetical protein